MELTLVRHLWGVSEPWEEAFPRIRAAGYTAVEAPLPAPSDRARFRSLLDEFGFAYVAMVFTEGSSVAEHLDSFRAQLDAGLALEPLLVNSHSGRDAWDEEASAAFFERALALERALGVEVAHETHRGRILYNPWATARLLERFDGLRLCCDLSHWVCVCERLLETELAIIERCARRCIHLHARVGYAEGPQVPDPRAPEYGRHVDAHERWWELIWDAQAAAGRPVSTLTPEFGPPDYLHTLPYTQAPVADLWAICDWQAHRQAARFRERHGQRPTG